jgi:glutathione S-transferase
MVDYVSVAEGRKLGGLRLVLSAGVPGPWSEAVKVVLDLKGIEYTPVRQLIGQPDPELREWTGQNSAPVACYEEERPRTRWDETLLLMEHLAPEPQMIPEDEALRAEVFGLLYAICGEDGFGWNFRLYYFAAIAEAQKLMSGDLGVMQGRYGDPRVDKTAALARVISVLDFLDARLAAARARGSRYFVGDSLTAVDIYWPAFSNLVRPLAHEICPMPDAYREMGKVFGTALDTALTPALMEHRDRIVADYYPKPMRF